MKKNILYYTLFTTMLFLSTVLKAQNTLLVYTRYPSQLHFIDAFNKVVPKKAIWSEKDGGYVINVTDLENTFIVADNENVSFKLSNNSQLTKLISMEGENNVALQKFFTNEKYCCEKLSDKQKKGTEKIFAVSVMKKGDNKAEPLVFDANIQSEISDLNNLHITWNTESEIKQIYLLNVNELKTIWDTEAFSEKSLDLSTLKAELKDDFKINNKYQLNILLKDHNPDVKYVYEFDYNELAFKTQDYHFASQDAVIINWETIGEIAKITLKDAVLNKTLFEKSEYDKNSFNFLADAEISEPLNPGTEYQINIKLVSGSEFNYNFMVLIGNDETEALKSIIE